MIFFKGKISIESLVNYLNNTLNDSDRDEIAKWINTSQENRKFFSKLKEIWQNHDDLSVLLNESRKKDLNKVLKECKSDNNGVKAIQTNSLKIWIRRIAAAILLLMVFTALGYFAGRKNITVPFVRNASLFHEILVPAGEKSEIILSDGTKIWINAGSSLRFPNAFSENSRDIWLNGEAYFEVSKNEHCPFLVHTSDIDVKVYGTKFNLKAYEDEDIFEATLIEGLVSLETRNILNSQKQEVFLKPNHKAIYLKKKPNLITNEIRHSVSEPIKPRKILITNPIPIDQTVSWREGRLVFFDETLENIAISLERRYGVVIKMEDKKLKNIRYSGVLKNISIEQALKAIQMSTEFSFEINDNIVTIEGPKTKRNS